MCFICEMFAEKQRNAVILVTSQYSNLFSLIEDKEKAKELFKKHTELDYELMIALDYSLSEKTKEEYINELYQGFLKILEKNAKNNSYNGSILKDIIKENISIPLVNLGGKDQ